MARGDALLPVHKLYVVSEQKKMRSWSEVVAEGGVEGEGGGSEERGGGEVREEDAEKLGGGVCDEDGDVWGIQRPTRPERWFFQGCILPPSFTPPTTGVLETATTLSWNSHSWPLSISAAHRINLRAQSGSFVVAHSALGAILFRRGELFGDSWLMKVSLGAAGGEAVHLWESAPPGFWGGGLETAVWEATRGLLKASPAAKALLMQTGGKALIPAGSDDVFGGGLALFDLRMHQHGGIRGANNWGRYGGTCKEDLTALNALLQIADARKEAGEGGNALQAGNLRQPGHLASALRL